MMGPAGSEVIELVDTVDNKKRRKIKFKKGHQERDKINLILQEAMPIKIVNCSDCHQQLTDEEIDYYEIRCDKCEGERSEEIYLWRNGKENKEFDYKYNLTKPTIN